MLIGENLISARSEIIIFWIYLFIIIFDWNFTKIQFNYKDFRFLLGITNHMMAIY